MNKTCDCEPFQVCPLCYEEEKQERDIEGEILDFLNAQPLCFAYKTDTKGNRKKGQWIKSNPREEKGKSDIVCTIAGKSVFIEVKKPGEKQTEDQEEFERKVTAAKAPYWLVYSCDEVEKLFKSFKMGLK